jgi:hypothetical protein
MTKHQKDARASRTTAANVGTSDALNKSPKVEKARFAEEGVGEEAETLASAATWRRRRGRLTLSSRPFPSRKALT